MKKTLLNRISADPAILHGAPAIAGHRIAVATVLDRLAAGESIKDLLADYDGVTLEDILACIAYGAMLARGSLLDVMAGQSK